jgi:hypothetical protein
MPGLGSYSSAINRNVQGVNSAHTNAPKKKWWPIIKAAGIGAE